MPITVAPASASARANWRWLAGKNGSTKTTFMPGMVTGYVLPMVVAGFVAPYLLEDGLAADQIAERFAAELHLFAG